MTLAEAALGRARHSRTGIPILRSREEVARLWLCERFIPAFHFFIGWPKTAEPTYERARAAGYLASARHLGRTGTQTKVLDVFAGDDDYVFFSVITPPRGMGPFCYGVVFDAKHLIDHGAIFGAYDLLHEYTKALDAALPADPWTGHPKAYYSGSARANEPDAMEKFYADLGEHAETARAAIQEVQQKYRLQGNRARWALGLAASIFCKGTRDVLRTARAAARDPSMWDNVRQRMEKTRKYGWSDAHLSAFRMYLHLAVMGANEHVKLGISQNPEILVRGTVPLDQAVAFLDVGCGVRKTGGLVGSVTWMEDLLRLLPGRERKQAFAALGMVE